MCDRTPRAELRLPALPSAAAAARRFMAAQLCATHCRELADDAMLLMSELVTNAVLHGGPPVTVVVDCDGRGVEVRVRDGNRALPRERPVALDAENGRGLHLLDVIADRWGVTPAEPHGKAVWFHLRTGAAG